MKKIKTRTLIWELNKRCIKRFFKTIGLILKTIFGLYKNAFVKSKAEFFVLILITLILIGTCFYVFKTRDIKLTRAVEVPRAEASEIIAEPVKPETVDVNGWALRIDNYLSSKGSPVTGQGITFVNAGLEWRVDPDLLVAICGADTSFGKHLASRYNLGNVGNDDAGNRVRMNSWADGIYAMAKVLNNQYLGDKQTVGSLSYGGGGTGKVYATSPYNWNKNVKSFTSELKGVTIDEGFQFRIN